MFVDWISKDDWVSAWNEGQFPGGVRASSTLGVSISPRVCAWYQSQIIPTVWLMINIIMSMTTISSMVIMMITTNVCVDALSMAIWEAFGAGASTKITPSELIASSLSSPYFRIVIFHHRHHHHCHHHHHHQHYHHPTLWLHWIL